tara:strand:- start:627 stop:1100 length:474 start_codon:yes stop_codon:yes gene_type:complete
MNLLKYMYKKILLSALLCCVLSAQYSYGITLSNEEYITGDDGVVRMYLNITGHVKNPGTYLAYDTIDFMSALSLAGGYIKGADLKNIIIISKDGNKEIINLNKMLNSNTPLFEAINLNPHDTIHIREKTLSKILLSSNLPSILLSLMNMIVTLNNSN